ncbi:hypothetical protein SASPL_114757 [Salvia splendens]|uniref:Retrotransposon gag domain-containing protein n=1 Tax=Salvia splendens TaxID=180675 RepID=A0A8X8Y6A2_SALSN|nr:hypothetical protein SASPL_114757 [Salvia splendens]
MNDTTSTNAHDTSVIDEEVDEEVEVRKRVVMPEGTGSMSGETPGEFNLNKVGQMVYDISVRLANDEKKIQANRFAHESFERQQSALNKSVEDHMARLLVAVEDLGKKPPDGTATVTLSKPQGWSLPRFVLVKPDGFDADAWPEMKIEPPRFSGEGVNLWIKKVQKYYNHNFTSLADRLYLTEFLLDDAADERFGFWETNNEGRSWEDFLLDIKRQFDPDLYEDYVGRLATLRQTGSLDAYLEEFEPTLRKVSNVGDDTLTSIYIAGLTPSLKHKLLTRRPSSLSDAIALAQQLAAYLAVSAPPITPSSRPPWQRRDQRASTGITPTDHVCAKKFYVLVGANSDDEETGNPRHEISDEDGTNMAITGDISRISVIGPKIKPRSIRMTGHINDTPLSVLIDGGMFVGNDTSLRCDYVSLGTPIALQGQAFSIDLVLLHIDGPDVVLGDVTKNYRTLQMKFELDSWPEPEAQMFELIHVDQAAVTDNAPMLPVNPLLADTLSASEFINAMIAWPTPTTAKQLRGFLGLSPFRQELFSHSVDTTSTNSHDTSVIDEEVEVRIQTPMQKHANVFDTNIFLQFLSAGNIVSFMVFLAPIPTFYQIYKKKSTAGFQSLPYIVGLFSAMLWMYYAFLKPDTTLLITINSVGCFIQSAYISFYLFFATKDARIQTVKLLLSLNVVGFGLVLFLTQFFATEANRGSIVGWICLVFSLCVFVAPLGVVGLVNLQRQVIRTKSVEYMPFLLSFFLTLSAVMWFFYGLLRKDYNIAIPNILGFSFGVIQMVLYLIYKKAKKGGLQEKQLSEVLEVKIEDHKISELKEQIIDVVKLGGMALEIIPLVADEAIILGGEKTCNLE